MARDALHPHLRDRYRWWWSITTRWSANDAYRQVNNAIYYLWLDTVVDAGLIELELPDVSAGDPIEIALDSGPIDMDVAM